MTPLYIKKDKFIRWYLSDEVDKYNMGCSVYDSLIRNHEFCITLEEIFLNMEYYPDHLYEPYEGSIEGRDVQLIK
jgi:hypothetical protein